MTFEQADRLTARIIAFMIEQGGPYPTMDLAYLQRCILETLARNQFVIRIDKKGIRYFANWFWLDDEALEGFTSENPEERVYPDIDCGDRLYVCEVVSRGEAGDAREMIRRIRQKCEKRQKGTFWHQAHRNHRLCTWKAL